MDVYCINFNIVNRKSKNVGVLFDRILYKKENCSKVLKVKMKCFVNMTSFKQS